MPFEKRNSSVHGLQAEISKKAIRHRCEDYKYNFLEIVIAELLEGA